MSYVDGVVLAVPAANRDAYRKLAEDMVPVFKRLSALQVVECWGDDVPDGKLTSFPMAVKKKADEAVVFSWIVWPSKEVRDLGNAEMMQDPVLKAWEEEGRQPPFDGMRMIYGGFEVLLDAKLTP